MAWLVKMLREQQLLKQTIRISLQSESLARNVFRRKFCIAEDQQIILCPTGWLNDKIISAAQCLLKNESKAEGLEESTAGLAYSFKLKKGEYLQPLNIG